MVSEPHIQKHDGISFVERGGTGTCLVFLHGIGSNAASFQPVFDLMPPEYHLLAWNAPGYGTSDPLAPAWPTARDYADALAGFLHGRGPGPIKLVGHSLGTLIGAAFARAYPDRVSKLVLASCAAGYGVPVGGEMSAAVSARIEELDAMGAAAFAKARAPRLVHNPEQNRDVVALVEAGMSQVKPAGYAQAVRMLASGNLYDDLHAVDMPCSFVTGTEDQVTPPEQTVGAAQAWARSHGAMPRIERIEQAGHAVYMQQPDTFTAALLRLVATPTDMIGDLND